MRKEGDVSRKRRLSGGDARVRWYARHRAARFARRFAVVLTRG
jgi:hypothetical protein